MTTRSLAAPQQHTSHALCTVSGQPSAKVRYAALIMAAAFGSMRWHKPNQAKANTTQTETGWSRPESQDSEGSNPFQSPGRISTETSDSTLYNNKVVREQGDGNASRRTISQPLWVAPARCSGTRCRTRVAA